MKNVSVRTNVVTNVPVAGFRSACQVPKYMQRTFASLSADALCADYNRNDKVEAKKHGPFHFGSDQTRKYSREKVF